MTGDNPEKPEPRVSPSIRFIEQFLNKRSPAQIMSLLLVQIDSFNRIATTFGTQAAREACENYAETLRMLLPAGSHVIRLSERRFALLMTPESEAVVSDLAEIIAEAHQPKIEIQESSFSVDVKLGAAMCPLHADDALTLFRRAELALQTARDNDESFAVYQPNATMHQATKWKLESDLKGAIANGEIEVHYQPKVELATDSVCGVEALVRWRTKDGRAISPDNFISIAERTGDIIDLTWSVFDSVVVSAQSWGTLKPSFGLAINVSPQVVNHSEFCTRLQALNEQLLKFDIKLAIELTEDSLLKSDNRSMANLHRIRELGVDLSIDDFGKGYSSLTYLKQVPATEIKIDKRFIETIGVDETDQQIVKAIFDLAHALDMRVVAEGVDSEENQDMVAQLGCDIAQGYLIARPMHGDDLVAWLQKYDSSPLEIDELDDRGSEQIYGY